MQMLDLGLFALAMGSLMAANAVHMTHPRAAAALGGTALCSALGMLVNLVALVVGNA